MPGETPPLYRIDRRPGLAFLVLFAVIFPVQAFFMTKAPEEWVRPHTRWELQAVAVSLAEGRGFSDPYMIPTGPTAHLPPIPPAIAGLTYRVLGPTLTAGRVVWLFHSAVYAAVWSMLPWVAIQVGLGGGAGILAGLVGGVIPRWPGHAEGLMALATILLMLAFLRRWRGGGGSRAGSLLLGIASGVAFHVQPALLLVVLGWMGFELWWTKGRRKWVHSGLMATGIVLACLPWAWRNYRTFDAAFFVRSNLGLELRMGNHDGAAAAMDVMDAREEFLHPRTHEAEARKVREMGEVAYMRQAGREATGWIRNNPGTFVRLTGSRMAHWWLGPLYDPPLAALFVILTVLALGGAWIAFPSLTTPQRWALLIPLLTYPLIYYVVAYMPRYRAPIDWIFLLLAGAAVLRPARQLTAITTLPRAWPRSRYRNASGTSASG